MLTGQEAPVGICYFCLRKEPCFKFLHSFFRAFRIPSQIGGCRHFELAASEKKNCERKEHNADPILGTVEALEKIVVAIRERLPGVKIVV